MKRLLGFFVVLTLLILIMPNGMAQGDDKYKDKQEECKNSFCDSISYCAEDTHQSPETCYQNNVDSFKDCVLGSKWTYSHSCGRQLGLCSDSCFEKFQHQENQDQYLNCDNECETTFQSCVDTTPIPTCTGETITPATSPKEKGECKQITEDTAKYNDQFYYPKCKDKNILLTYVCQGATGEPEETELDCRKVEYGTGKYYSSCSQPSGQQGSCSKDNPEITLEELKLKLGQIKNNDNELYLYVIENPEIVYMAWKNKDTLSNIKYTRPETDYETDIWLKLAYIQDDINRMKENAYTHIKAGESLRDYITDNKNMELWQFKLYSQLKENVGQQKQAEAETIKMNEEIKQLEKENEKFEREKFWKEDATFVDKLDYKLRYATTFQALREKGYSGIFNDDPKAHFHEQITEASGVLAYLPGTGDGIEIATLPSVLLDERMSGGMKTFHVICAALPFVSSEAVEKISYAISGYSFTTSEPEHK